MQPTTATTTTTHTHTHLFNGPFSGTTRVSRYQKGKPIWILLKQVSVSSSGISWAICKSAPRSSTPPLSFLQAGCPSCCPTNSVKALKAKALLLLLLPIIIIINNVDLSDDQWAQASLPVRNGGLGIRSAQMLAPSAFLASAASTLELQQSILPPSIQTLADKSTQTVELSWAALSGASKSTGKQPCIQKAWDGLVSVNQALLVTGTWQSS